MTLNQLSALRQWHLRHKRERPLEFHTWDAMLTLWLMGWMGVPAALILWQPLDVVGCILLFFVPTAYVTMRQRLHERGRLRCDWLGVAAAAASAARPGGVRRSRR